MFELMLDEEQPDTDRCGDQQDRQVDQQEGFQADQPDQQTGHQRDRQVVGHRAEPRQPAVAHQADRQPMLQEEQVGWSEAEHDQWMAVETVAQPAPHRTRAIFLDGQGVDVAEAPPVQISGAGVVGRMHAAPDFVGCQRQNAGDAADPVVGQAMAEKGAMPAIVLDREQPQHESAGDESQRQGDPVADVERRPGKNPQRNERHDRDDDLEDASAVAGLAIGRQELGPHAGFGHARRRAGGFRTVAQANDFP